MLPATCDHFLISISCRNSSLDPATPIYEDPPSAYTADGIMMILLNPNIDSSRICEKVPTSVTTDATYVIDVTSLAHPDDVKKDNFGKWDHKGSHPIAMYVRMKSNGKVSIKRCPERKEKYDLYKLRRLYCTHPSNPTVKGARD